MKLIINADDLGFTKGINYGILDAFEAGIVTSASVMMNMPTTEHGLSLFRDKAIGLGVHLNVTSGRPLIKNIALTDEDGFFNKKHDLNKEILFHIIDEFEAQIKKALDLNMAISHLSSFGHIHMQEREIFELTWGLAKKYKVKMRCDRGYKYLDHIISKEIPSTTAFSLDFYDKTVHVNHLTHIINQHLNEESLEIMVHPGFICGQLIHKDSYQEMRVVEHSILTSDYMKAFIKSKAISLIHFGNL